LVVMSTADQPQPMAQGDLAKTPFAHLVLYLHREGLSGTLVIDRGGFETKILFRNGRGVAARPLPRGTALQDGLLELCAVEAAPYGFWDGDLLGDASGVVQGTIDPLTFVTESLRGHVRDVVVSSVVDRYRGVALRLLPEADPKRLGIRGGEARAAERLRERAATPEEFYAARSELNPDELRRLLYLLLITRHAAPDGGEASSASGVRAAVDADIAAQLSSAPPPAGQSRAPSLRPSASPGSKISSNPPPGSSSAQRSVSSQPAAAASQRPAGSRPAPSRVTPPPFASPPSVRSPARPSTPANMPAVSVPPSGAPGAGSRPPTAGRASIPAWQQLASMRAGTPRSQPAAPPVVVPSLAPPPLEALDNDGKLRRAEKLIERRNFDEGMRIVDDLIARDATKADYHAVRAWALYEQFTGNQPPRSLIEAIERALRLNDEQPRALYLKGLVLKRIGKDAEAIRAFQRTLEADPRHIEAQRELRLAKMRRDR
jgi:tetratricopeptide (TPR) repeat protein